MRAASHSNVRFSRGARTLVNTRVASRKVDGVLGVVIVGLLALI
jgi:hypothetical protein